MEIYNLLGSLFILIFCGLFLRKVWLGAAMALLVYVAVKSFYHIDYNYIISPIITGIIISVELSLLLFGAYLFYTLLQANNYFETLNKIMSSFSSKLSVVIILCYFLGSFMEGIAGFGIPAMLIAPMLLSLGFKPLTCIILPLAANTTAVTFGALGTPLKVGLGIYEPDAVVKYTVLLNFIPAIALPFLLAFLYEKTEGTKLNWHKSWKMLLAAGVIYGVLYRITGTFTIEYVSVISGIIGLLIFVFLNVPKNENPPLFVWLKTFYPYLAFIVFLLIAKFFLSDSYWILSHHAKPVSLYQPGAIFILTGFLYYFFIVKSQFSCYYQCKETLRITLKPIITILLLVCYAQLIRNELSVVAQAFLNNYNDTAKLFINPLLGVSGSFLSGSATMSNIIFGKAIQSAAIISTNLPLLIALFHTGSAIGNAISLQNILMVQSVVNEQLVNYSKILKLNLIIVGIYLLIVIIYSLILIN